MISGMLWKSFVYILLNIVSLWFGIVCSMLISEFMISVMVRFVIDM